MPDKTAGNFAVEEQNAIAATIMKAKVRADNEPTADPEAVYSAWGSNENCTGLAQIVGQL
jgi:hypothetical protein